MLKWHRKLGVIVFSAGLAAFAGAASAEDLVIGFQGNPNSMDPHYATTPTNATILSNIYEPLVLRNSQSKIDPNLAVSWRLVDDVTWEFKLRPNVTFSDGTPFTAEDVKFSYQRAPAVPGSPSSLKLYTKLIKAVEVVDPMTVQVITHGPSPSLLADLSNLPIISGGRKDVSIEDFNKGSGAPGTGPYKFVSWSSRDSIVMERNASYWGGVEPWEKVTYKVMRSDPARIAALLAGDIDVANMVPSQDLEKLRANPDISVWSGITSRFAWIGFPPVDDVVSTGMITDHNDKPLDKNPMTDIRVRKAMKLAIDLDLLADRLFRGTAIPTGQYQGPAQEAHVEDIKPWKADLEKARQLMKEADWEKGFRTTVVASSTAIPEASKVLEGIAQAWARIGIVANMQTVPTQIYLKRRNKGEFAIQATQFANTVGTPESTFAALLHTRQPKRGLGQFNRTGYSNPKLDAIVEKALVTVDDSERLKLFEEATHIAIDDTVIVPTWHFIISTATRRGIKFIPRLDSQLRAYHVRPDTK